MSHNNNNNNDNNNNNVKFQQYAEETAGKAWNKITFKERLKIRKIFDKLPSGLFHLNFITLIN
jgi:hypothetical protein